MKIVHEYLYLEGWTYCSVVIVYQHHSQEMPDIQLKLEECRLQGVRKLAVNANVSG